MSYVIKVCCVTLRSFYIAFFARFLDILRENGETGDIKECPLCQVLIMREAGCAQMMCGHCKHIFCWHCRKSLDVSNWMIIKLYMVASVNCNCRTMASLQVTVVLSRPTCVDLILFGLKRSWNKSNEVGSNWFFFWIHRVTSCWDITIKVLAETSWATPEHHCFYIEHRLGLKMLLSYLHFWYSILTMIERTEYSSQIPSLWSFVTRQPKECNIIQLVSGMNSYNL